MDLWTMVEMLIHFLSFCSNDTAAKLDSIISNADLVCMYRTNADP